MLEDAVIRSYLGPQAPCPSAFAALRMLRLYHTQIEGMRMLVFVSRSYDYTWVPVM